MFFNWRVNYILILFFLYNFLTSILWGTTDSSVQQLIDEYHNDINYYMEHGHKELKER